MRTDGSTSLSTGIAIGAVATTVAVALLTAILYFAPVLDGVKP